MTEPKVRSYIGSLHTSKVIERYKRLGASDEVLAILEDGLDIHFTQDYSTISFEKRNNKVGIT